MRFVTFVLLLLFYQIAQADNVFSDNESKISFRYPDQWSERKPQLHTTLVLLYADDGSEATCNISSKKLENLKHLSEAQLNKLRASNHKKEEFVEQLNGAFPNLVIKRYWRGAIGQKDAGIVEIEHDLFVNDTRVRIIQFMGSTFANGRRFTLTCNAPAHSVIAAQKAFDYIRNTMLFTY